MIVSGLVTSPEDQLRIFFGEVRPISMASKSLMSMWASLLGSVRVRRGGGRSGGTEADFFASAFSAQLRLQGLEPLLSDLLTVLVSGLAVLGADPGEVDAELFGGAEQLVLLLFHSDRAFLGDEVGVERQGLHLLQQDLERGCN